MSDVSKRFILQESSTSAGDFVCTDTVNMIVCRFHKGSFNDTQVFIVLDDSNAFAGELARLAREMGDWLRENHYGLLFNG